MDIKGRGEEGWLVPLSCRINEPYPKSVANWELTPNRKLSHQKFRQCQKVEITIKPRAFVFILARIFSLYLTLFCFTSSEEGWIALSQCRPLECDDKMVSRRGVCIKRVDYIISSFYGTTWTVCNIVRLVFYQEVSNQKTIFGTIRRQPPYNNEPRQEVLPKATWFKVYKVSYRL